MELVVRRSASVRDHGGAAGHPGADGLAGRQQAARQRHVYNASPHAAQKGDCRARHRGRRASRVQRPPNRGTIAARVARGPGAANRWERRTRCCRYTEADRLRDAPRRSKRRPAACGCSPGAMRWMAHLQNSGPSCSGSMRETSCRHRDQARPAHREPRSHLRASRRARRPAARRRRHSGHRRATHVRIVRVIRRATGCTILLRRSYVESLFSTPRYRDASSTCCATAREGKLPAATSSRCPRRDSVPAGFYMSAPHVGGRGIRARTVPAAFSRQNPAGQPRGRPRRRVARRLGACNPRDDSRRAHPPDSDHRRIPHGAVRLRPGFAVREIQYSASS